MKYLLVITLIFLSFSGFTQILGLEQGMTYAVVVGISDYQEEAIPDLQFADKDALAFAGFLRSPAGGSLNEDHLKVLLNEQATGAQFAIALDWLLEVAQENDKVIIYFSGHGDVERKTITQPGFLLCWDAPAKVYMSGGAFGLTYLQEIISTLSIQTKAKVIMIVDACRAGKLSGSIVGGAELTNANLAKQYANEIKILSCQPDEYSIEGEEWGGGRGAFSYHLLDGLYGMADRDEDLNVNLKEIGRYLEDKVSSQVEPYNQNPVIVGSKTEKLTQVFPDLLAQIHESKKGQLQLFSPTESRSIEDEVLAAADSNIVQMYWAFKESLVNKNFLCDTTEICADFYYSRLAQEPSLEKLHSSMRRNYAAALQDDAQQVMNNWLSGDVEELSLSKINQAFKYRFYPDYLERAAELLGKEHYMYQVLKARSLYFEAYLMHIDLRGVDKPLGRKALLKYREALEWQPDAAHVYNGMVWVYYCQMQQPDSAEYYAHQAVELAPSWFLPYSNLGFLYSEIRTIPEKSRYFLELVDQVDSTAAQSNPWHISNVGVFYLKSKQYPKAIEQYRKAIQLDSTISGIHSNLGNVYLTLGQYADALEPFKKAIQLDSTNAIAQNNLGIIYVETFRFYDAADRFREAIRYDSTFWMAYSNLGITYQCLERWEAAAAMTRKAMDLYPDDGGMHAELAYSLSHIPSRLEEAKANFEKARTLDNKWPDTYLFLAQFTLRTSRSDQSKALAHGYLQKAFEKGIGKNGVINKNDLKTRKDFEILRKEPIWTELMQQYFPDQFKD